MESLACGGSVSFRNLTFLSFFFCSWGESRANLGMYLHQKDSPAASILVSDHFFIILGTYLFAIFLFKLAVLLSRKHKHSHCHTQTHNGDGKWRCHFHWKWQGKAYIHTVLRFLISHQFVSLLISTNDTSIYLVAYAKCGSDSRHFLCLTAPPPQSVHH